MSEPYVNPLGLPIKCNLCGVTVYLPYEDDDKKTVLLQPLEGWTSPPALCPPCTTLKSMLSK